MFTWTGSSQERLKAAEDKLLGTVEGIRVFDTDIGNGHYIHAVEGGKNKSKIPLVMTHGYGMAIGGWYMILPELTASTHVLAIDWLGWGLSSRPSWELKGTEETEAFFVDGLERWREANRLEKMILLGHSLGGYLSVAYSEKYPDRVESLILASPVGFPEEPEGSRDVPSHMPFPQRFLLKLVRWGWARGVTPGDTFRIMGRSGHWLMRKFSNVRFSGDYDRDALAEYFFHNIVGSYDSGQRAVNCVLKPGAWAFSPLRYRLPKLDSSIPVHFIYGDDDIMDSTSAKELKEAAEADNKGQKVTVFVLPDATHSLFLTNPRGFTAELLRICGVKTNASDKETPSVTTLSEVKPEAEIKA